MPKINIETVYVVRSKGKEYHYAYRGKGAPRLYEKAGSAAYIAELQKYQEAVNSRGKGTIAALSQEYRASHSFEKLSATTKKSWSAFLNIIEQDFADVKVSLFENPKIRQSVMIWRDKWKHSPRSADYALQVLSRLLSYACEKGDLKLNPLPSIKRLYQATGERSDIIWEQQHLDLMEKVASYEVFIAIKLATMTGFRRSDLLALKWTDIKADRISIATGKSRGKIHARVPLYQELRLLLESIPKRADTVLTTTKGQPWGVGFSSSFNKAKRAAGVDLHFHDARGTLATFLAKAKIPNSDIAEIMGWKPTHVERILERYVSGNARFNQIVETIDAHQTTPK